jgi:hypothetical protein
VRRHWPGWQPRYNFNYRIGGKRVVGITVMSCSFIQEGVQILWVPDSWPALPMSEVFLVGDDTADRALVEPLVKFLLEISAVAGCSMRPRHGTAANRSFGIARLACFPADSSIGRSGCELSDDPAADGVRPAIH